MNGLEALENLGDEYGIVNVDRMNVTRIYALKPYKIVKQELKDYYKLRELVLSACCDFPNLKKKIKEQRALEIIKETPEFAWYVKVYKNAYEMASDLKGFRTNNSVEELQEMFDILKEVLS